MNSSKDGPHNPTPLGCVLRTGELTRRPSCHPDYAAESQSMTVLASVLARSPASALQCIAECAVKLCGVHSCGIFLLHEDGVENAREAASAGAPISGLKPADCGDSPFDVAIERATPQLFAEPQRHFTYLALNPQTHQRRE